MPRPQVPFAPKSNAHLLPGDFWALPLLDGRFSAGRVLARQAFGPADRVGFIAGLLDWVSDEPPTEHAIAGAAVLAWGLTRVDAIAKTGGEVLGHRALSADGLDEVRLTQEVGEKSSVWGWRTILTRAEGAFVDRR